MGAERTLRAVRQAGAVVVGVGVAVVGALILGEYELGVVSGIVAGLLLGFALAEAALMTAGARALGGPLAALLGAAAFGSLVWAGWIDVHHRDEAIPAGAWLGGVAAAAVVVLRTGRGSARTAGSSSPPGPPRTP
jgi:hypothetical protein